MAQTAPDFGLARIGQIGLTVKDLDRAVAFYRDTLGMKLLFRVPNMAFFDCAGIRLMLGLPEGTNEVFRSLIYYRVDDIDKAFQILSARGVAFETKPRLIARLENHDLWLAAFRDPDQNVVELMSEVPRK